MGAMEIQINTALESKGTELQEETKTKYDWHSLADDAAWGNGVQH